MALNAGNVADLSGSSTHLVAVWLKTIRPKVRRSRRRARKPFAVVAGAPPEPASPGRYLVTGQLAIEATGLYANNVRMRFDGEPREQPWHGARSSSSCAAHCTELVTILDSAVRVGPRLRRRLRRQPSGGLSIAPQFLSGTLSSAWSTCHGDAPRPPRCRLPSRPISTFCNPNGQIFPTYNAFSRVRTRSGSAFDALGLRRPDVYSDSSTESEACADIRDGRSEYGRTSLTSEILTEEEATTFDWHTPP